MINEATGRRWLQLDGSKNGDKIKSPARKFAVKSAAVGGLQALK